MALSTMVNPAEDGTEVFDLTTLRAFKLEDGRIIVSVYVLIYTRPANGPTGICGVECIRHLI